MTTLFSPLNSLQVGPGIVLAKAVGGNAPSVISPIEFEGLQSSSLDIDTKIVSASGQLMMPFDSAPVDRTIKGTLEMLVLNGTLFSNIISGDSPTTGGTVLSYRESHTLASTAIATIAATTAYTLGQIVTDGATIGVCTVAGTTASTILLGTTLGASTILGTATFVSVCLDTGAPTHACAVIVTNSTTFATDKGVMYQSSNNQLGTLGGSQAAALPAPPAVGQYVSAGTSGVYLFNSTDTVGVFITYSYTSATLTNTFPLLNHWIGWGPVCEVNFEFPYQSSQNGTEAAINVGIFLAAVRFGSQKMKTKRDGYMTVTYDFEAFAPPSGAAGYLYLPN